MTPPRDPESTRDRLVAAAIRLFGENGIEATSLRALTEAAGANIAAVNYHFGSKDGLLRSVIDHSMRSVNAERDRRLDELEAAPRPPDVAALVRAFIEPAADLTRTHGDRGREVARFLGRVLSEANPRTRQIFADQVDAVEGRYLDAMGRALPERDAAEVRFAYTSMLGLLSAYQTGAFADIEFRTGFGHGADRERLIAFVTAGIAGCHIPPGGL